MRGGLVLAGFVFAHHVSETAEYFTLRDRAHAPFPSHSSAIVWGDEAYKSAPHPMAGNGCHRDIGIQPTKEEIVRGTIVCGITDNDEGHSALELGAELSKRLGMRLCWPMSPRVSHRSRLRRRQ